MTLDELAFHYRTDKASDGHFYTRHYERMFGPVRIAIESVCEIGIGTGASLRVWREWFPNAMIYGVDMNHTEPLGDRIECFECEQTDCKCITECLQGTEIEIIIEDCSHELSKTMATLECLWPLVRPRGWYVIEDMCTDSYPARIGEWYSLHSVEIRDMYLFRNKCRSNIITFIQKQ